MKDIATDMLETVSGGMMNLAAPTTPRRGSSSSNLALQTALTGVTSALDSLKQNQNNTLNQLLPVVLMARWIRQRG